MSTTDETDRLRRLEYAIFGVRGDNGLASEVRALRQEFVAYREEEADRREADRMERKADRRFQITTTIAIIAAILVAAGIVASAI